ncbi:MAG: type II toxin-antitoxin system HicB family antitoxin [bacterium]
MVMQYTAVIKKEGDWWIGWIEEIQGVNCQEKTKEDLLKSLKITLKEAIDMNKQEAIREASTNYIEASILI